MRKRILTTLVLAALSLTGARAQNVIDLIISEALAEPDSTGIVDDYGRRGGWIEIFNTSQGTVNFGGCFLTDDPDNLTKSIIPKGDLKTKLGPRQTALIYASGNGSDGTFYADFTVRPGSTLYLVSNDGRTIIDSITVPADLQAGKSVWKTARDLRLREFEQQAAPGEPSPGLPNFDTNAATKAQAMAEKDPHGFILSLVAVLVVFSALAILWLLFWIFFDRPAKKKAMAASAHRGKGAPVIPGAAKESPSDEVAAVIALAMDLQQDGDAYAAIVLAMDLYFSDSVHDNEPFILTMKPQGQSAWNDKKQNFRKLPR